MKERGIPQKDGVSPIWDADSLDQWPTVIAKMFSGPQDGCMGNEMLEKKLYRK